MPANTSKGWPYILPADNVADYPVTSQALANFADAAVPYAQAAGQATVTLASGTGTVAVTFPASRFSVAPLVQATKSSGNGATIPVVPYVGSITTTGFTLGCAGGTYAGSVLHNWQAVQMLTSAAPGVLAAVDGTTGRVVTCHTDGCDNGGLPIPLLVPDGSDPDIPTPTDYVCGVCGQPIDDVAEVAGGVTP